MRQMETSSLTEGTKSTYISLSSQTASSKEYLVTPDIVEYDKKKMTTPVYDPILGCKTMKKLGIVLDFKTKEMTVDEIILPMRDISSLT